jgi:hypothetical protein
VAFLSVYRIAAYLQLFFCAMHTFRGLLAAQGRGILAEAVLSGMKATHFSVMGSDCTWYSLYLGFGLLFSLFLLVSAALTWFLGGLSLEQLRSISPVAVLLFVGHVGIAVVSWAFFFAAPGVLATLVAALLGVQCARIFALKSPAAAPHAHQAG